MRRVALALLFAAVVGSVGVARAQERGTEEQRARLVAWVRAHPEVRAIALTAPRPDRPRVVAVEDGGGLTSCAVGPEDDGGRRPPPVCVRQPGAELVAGLPPELESAGDGSTARIRVVVRVGGVARVQLHGADGTVLDAGPARGPMPGRAAIVVGEALFDRPPWAPSARAANRAARRRPRPRGAVDVQAVRAPDVARLVRCLGRVAVSPLARDGGRSVWAVRADEDAWDDPWSRPSVDVLLVRDGESVRVSSPPSEERIEAARFADTIAPGAVVALSEPSHSYGVAEVGQPNGSTLSLVLFMGDGTALRRYPLLDVGERGFIRRAHRSVVWRVFHRVVPVAPDCLEVQLDHSWRAAFDRRTGRFGTQRRLVLPSSGPPDAPGAGLAGVVGRYRLAGGTLVRSECGGPQAQGPPRTARSSIRRSRCTPANGSRSCGGSGAAASCGTSPTTAAGSHTPSDGGSRGPAPPASCPSRPAASDSARARRRWRRRRHRRRVLRGRPPGARGGLGPDRPGGAPPAGERGGRPGAPKGVTTRRDRGKGTGP